MTVDRGERVDAIVIGAGAVGSYVAARLASVGASVVVLERRPEPVRHSRAIGVHPPGLDLLDGLGVAHALVDAGVRVTRGHALTGTPRRGLRSLGVVDFGTLLRGRWRFILTVPQWRTEQTLAEEVVRRAPGSLHRGVDVASVRETTDGVDVDTDVGTWRGRLVIACDGSRSAFGATWGGDVHERRLPDRYMMIDVRDDPRSADAWGEDAAIVVHRDGVVEAFPLPGGVRRWVVKVDGDRRDPSASGHAGVGAARGRHDPPLDGAIAAEVARIVEARTGRVLDLATVEMTSQFGVRRRHVARVAVGRRWLAGDAAHVIPPIGGQGMTLGWLGAEALVDAIGAWRDGRCSLVEAGTRYQRTYASLARAAARRAQVNLSLGRATRLAPLRNAVVRTMLLPPLDRRMAETFTMQR